MEVWKQLTVTTLVAAISSSLLVLALLAKFFKDWKDVRAGFVKFWKGAGMVWKWIMKNAIWKRDVDNKLDLIAKQLEFVVAELKYNGGTSTKDAVKRVEQCAFTVATLVDTHHKRMDIADLANSRMTFRMDTEGACTEINEVFLKKFGYSEKDVLGYAFEQIVHEEDVKEMRIKWQRAIDQKGRFYDEQRICYSDGKCEDCCVRGFPVIINNQLIEFIGHIEILNKNK